MATLIVAEILDALVDAVDTARAATTDQRWLNALNTGFDWLLQQDVITFDAEKHELTVNSPSGNEYKSNGACQCEAFAQHNACWHRAASRCVKNALAAQQAERLYAAFTAPSDALYLRLSDADQDAYWQQVDAMRARADAEYNARRDARSAQIARAQAARAALLECFA